MEIRFIHAADTHLGSPLEAVGAESEQLQTQLRDATYTAFERIIDLALAEAVDFILLAGDLYDQKNRSVRANGFLADQLDRLDEADIPAYIIYGNHDPVGDATTYVDLPPNVHEFGHQNAEKVLYPSEDAPKARISGQSYRTEAEQRAMHTDFELPEDNLPNIGLLHTGLDPESDQYVPSSPAELADVGGIDYWALGHIHQPEVYDQDPPVVQAGVPQGRHIGEDGPSGCFLIEMDGTGDTEMEFIPTGPVIWQEYRIPIDGDTSDDMDTIAGIRRHIEQESEQLGLNIEMLESRLGIPVRRPDWEPDGYVCRWILSERGELHEFLSSDEEVLHHVAIELRESLARGVPFVYTEAVKDRTGPPLPDIDELRDSDRVVDEYFALLDDLSGDETTREAMKETVDYDNSRNVWQLVEDPEALDDDKLALTDEKLDELIERAEQHLLNKLLSRRAA